MKILIENGSLDSDNNILKLEGLKIPETVPLCDNFRITKTLGQVRPQLIEGKLYANIDDNILNDYKKSYPAIGFKVIENSIENNGINTITKSELLIIGLCSNPNSDPNIKSIGEQLCQTK